MCVANEPLLCGNRDWIQGYLLCVLEESDPAVLDQPTPPLLCVMEKSGPAVLDQPTPPLLCVMEESGPAVLDQPTPPLLCLLLLCSSSRGNKENSTRKPAAVH